MSRRTLATALGLAAALLGLFLLYRVFERTDIGEVFAVLGSVSFGTIAVALLLTFGSFACIAILEVLAVRYTAAKIALPRTACTAIAAIGIGHAVGLAALSSGAIRYRMYSRAGMKLVAVGKVVVFSGVSVASGYAAVGGTAMLWRGDFLGPLLGVAPGAVRGFAIAILTVLLCYVALCAFWRRTLTFRHHKFRLPSIRLALGQIAFSGANLLCIAGVLYFCLRSFTDTEYPVVAILYVGSDLSAVVGHVPGGWGVLEYIITEALTDGQVLSGVILFRAIYYLLPLLAGLLVFAVDEIRSRGRAHPDRNIHQSVAEERS